MTETVAQESLTEVDDWKREWQPVVDAIGRDFSDGEIQWGADTVERGAIRRFTEPLELDCALHTDPVAAMDRGFADVTMPYVAMMSATIPAMRGPSEVLFDSDERNAQPARSPINNEGLGIGPKTTGFIGTDIDMDFLRPVVAGERLGRRSNRLVACSPKETALGRGAFLKWECDIVTEAGEVVARQRTGTFAYVPTQKGESS
ncbi:MaoC family dehydratase N-terminal domain-containing protein [Rhodococcus sp. KBS0724]|uniref:FAS1-like dehydratase domain-containing protein n=1 Tax=Rhodococcus sp. KBS0724 TaxID=1179674 RepID=UPI0021B10603|nr:MaoC family dehydratase N-terminal domain-containing protein [Rhodococcus sp. KBS0724]